MQEPSADYGPHNCHCKSKSLTAKANHSRQEQITHGKRKSLTAKANSFTEKENKLNAIFVPSGVTSVYFYWQFYSLLKNFWFWYADVVNRSV